MSEQLKALGERIRETRKEKGLTQLELAEKVIKLTGSDSKIVFKPLPSDDPTQRKPVIDIAKKELDWEPHIVLDEGLKKTIEYFRGKLGL